MSSPRRCFVAVQVPRCPRLEAVLEELRSFGGTLRPVRVDQLHVTLKFLGSVAESEIPALAGALRAAVTETPPARCSIVGLGAFPAPARPQVLWAGLREASALIDLAARIESVCETFGFARERRPFHPHLTLARVNRRPPDRLGELLQLHAETPWGEFDLESAVLFESVLGRGGARHVPLATFPVDAESRDL